MDFSTPINQKSNMIRIKFKQHLDDKCFREKRKITMDIVSKETEMSRTRLMAIANTPGYNTNINAIDKLCKYFDTTPCELLEYIEDV